MSWIKQHWKLTLPLAALILCVLVLGTYVAFVNSEQREPTIIYTMPESRQMDVRLAQTDHKALPPVSVAQPTEAVDLVTPLTPEELAEYKAAKKENEALHAKIAETERELDAANAIIAEAEAQGKELAALEADGLLIAELNTWILEYYYPAMEEFADNPLLGIGSVDELFAEFPDDDERENLLRDIEKAMPVIKQFARRLASLPTRVRQIYLDGIEKHWGSASVDVLIPLIEEFHGGES